ncbi:DUF2848 domain-containing protein [Pandoraea sputorum]|uniref:Protein of uncharacterized function (DUF2848) n=1 Tax=Pandoraea sputorum TaxID=93222 RepID=A0A239SD43_9BURK|nr:DUF2848 domain-containing protein [Pandoraea sputorum]AJC16442.1 hypothetical protein NA29_11065 [Pandoraea sputorum]SNU83189.1 Protein of uncharacterised function (DUF2848) [Pandoraea sputorum]VVE15956.1 hypothetical protein PSP20601_02891 [Pandoraea sputorum]VVE82881.1 hypothetical protein PSP31120_03822 [Pandoraea sputorum]
MSSCLSFTVAGDGAALCIDVSIDTLIIAGWAGRDRHAVEHHIAELAALGVRRPSTTPCFYRLAPALLAQDDAIDVVGETSSGEAECVLVRHGDELFVSVGSDHTDREVEAYGVTVSKQVCAKPVAREAWRFAEVAAHWDQLELRSWVTREGERRLYQEGTVAGLLSPQELMAKLGPDGLPAGAAMFCGTLAAIGGVAGGEQFEIELHDPVLGRTIRHRYATQALAIAD